MRLHLGKTAIRATAAAGIITVLTATQAFAASWSHGLNCAPGHPAGASFEGNASSQTTATFTWTICDPNFGCGTSNAYATESGGTQYYESNITPNTNRAYITNVSISFPGTFVTTPYATCG